jgi:hypothetical protein
MSFDLKTLYELLPSIYRIRDIAMGQAMITPDTQAAIAQLQTELNALSDPDSQAADDIRELIDQKQRGPLKALLSVIAGQVAVLDENLNQLYDDQFIETCAEWVVPYIGDLIGARGLLSISDAEFSQRPVVANTIGYRRRKGTVTVLEQLARDVTGWNASVVEYFRVLATTQYLNHQRAVPTIDVRNRSVLQWLDTPFDKAMHTADTRRIESGRGKYNIPNIGIFLWRIASCPLHIASPYQVDGWRYTFDALGKNTPLYNFPVPVQTVTQLSTQVNVPMPMPRGLLRRDLATYYGEGLSLAVYMAHQLVPSTDITICDLGDQHEPGDRPDGSSHKHTWNPPYADPSVPWYNLPQTKVAIDPVRGRLAFPAGQAPPASVEVSYCYGFSANMGGGEYERADSFVSGLQPVISVPTDAPTIQAALDLVAANGGVVQVEGNGYYYETPVVNVTAGTTIELRAADESRPVLVLGGALEIYGGTDAAFNLNGFLIAGGYLHVPLLAPDNQSNALYTVNVKHCTLVPGPTPGFAGAGGSGSTPPAPKPSLPRLVIETPDIKVSVDQSILGKIRSVDGAGISISNSIVDAGHPTETAFADLGGQGPGATLTASNTTIIGKVYATILNVSDSIFLARLTRTDRWPEAVMAERLQEGCARFSYFPPGSRIPKPYHCQPASAAADITIQPAFTSLRYGDAGYGQLSSICPTAISQGADDGAEMGAFHSLYQPQRIANLQAQLDEYLRFSMEAGIFRAS